MKGSIRLSKYDLGCIDQAIAYIDQRFRDSLSAEQLSEEIGLDIRKLRAGFKRRTGYMPHEYLFKVRIEKAKSLLQETCHPLKIIAFNVGFKNESHFCKKFKQWTTMTPIEFRYLIDEQSTESETAITEMNIA